MPQDVLHNSGLSDAGLPYQDTAGTGDRVRPEGAQYLFQDLCPSDDGGRRRRRARCTAGGRAGQGSGCAAGAGPGGTVGGRLIAVRLLHGETRFLSVQYLSGRFSFRWFTCWAVQVLVVQVFRVLVVQGAGGSVVPFVPQRSRAGLWPQPRSGPDAGACTTGRCCLAPA